MEKVNMGWKHKGSDWIPCQNFLSVLLHWNWLESIPLSMKLNNTWTIHKSSNFTKETVLFCVCKNASIIQDKRSNSSQEQVYSLWLTSQLVHSWLFCSNLTMYTYTMLTEKTPDWANYFKGAANVQSLALFVFEGLS